MDEDVGGPPPERGIAQFFESGELELLSKNFQGGEVISFKLCLEHFNELVDRLKKQMKALVHDPISNEDDLNVTPPELEKIKALFTTGEMLSLEQTIPDKAKLDAAFENFVKKIKQEKNNLKENDHAQGSGTDSESSPEDESDDASDVVEVCNICDSDEKPEELLLCDCCNDPYHLQCLNPPLDKVPVGNWFCPACIAVNFEELKEQREALERLGDKLDKEKSDIDSSFKDFEHCFTVTPQLYVAQDDSDKDPSWSLLKVKEWPLEILSQFEKMKDSDREKYDDLLQIHKKLLNKYFILQQDTEKFTESMEKNKTNPWFTNYAQCEEDRTFCQEQARKNGSFVGFRGAAGVASGAGGAAGGAAGGPGKKRDRENEEADDSENKEADDSNNDFHVHTRGVYCEKCDDPNLWSQPEWMEMKQRAQSAPKKLYTWPWTPK